MIPVLSAKGARRACDFSSKCFRTVSLTQLENGSVEG